MVQFNLELTYLEHLTVTCYPGRSLSLSQVLKRRQAELKKERTKTGLIFMTSKTPNNMQYVRGVQSSTAPGPEAFPFTDLPDRLKVATADIKKLLSKLSEHMSTQPLAPFASVQRRETKP